MEAKIGQDSPPAITHPEFFYGFLGVAIAWQVAFLMISCDLQRFRPFMIPTILEKASFGLAVVPLWLGDRISGQMLAAGMIDLLLGVLFVISFRQTPANWDTHP